MIEKALLFSISIILLTSLIPNSDALVNLENTSFLSDDGNLMIDFGKNIVLQKKSSDKILPALDFGIIQTEDYDFILDFTDDVSIKVYGNSFVIKSLDNPPLLIYARHTDGINYIVNAYTVENGLKKHTFTGKLEPIPGLAQRSVDESLQPETTEKLPKMNLLVQHTERVYWQSSYLITARVFDTELNRINDFNQNWGYIPGIGILIEIFNDDNELLTSMSGNTGTTGYYDATYYVVQHLVPRGTYTVNVTADNGQVQLTKTLSLHVLGDKSSGGNSTGP